jgi:hypothetical protein
MSSSSQILFVQGLANVTSSAFPKPESSVFLSQLSMKPATLPTRSSKASPPLRTRIGVKCSAVLDISPQDYWRKHKAMVSAARADHIVSVTLLPGSLIRDRIEEKSCASLVFTKILLTLIGTICSICFSLFPRLLSLLKVKRGRLIERRYYLSPPKSEMHRFSSSVKHCLLN